MIKTKISSGLAYVGEKDEDGTMFDSMLTVINIIILHFLHPAIYTMKKGNLNPRIVVHKGFNT